jgi:hypothetical protein
MGRRKIFAVESEGDKAGSMIMRKFCEKEDEMENRRVYKEILNVEF